VRRTTAAAAADGIRADGGPARPSADTKVRRYRMLVVGCAVSSYGSYLNMIALNLFVYVISHSALVMGLFMAARLAAGFVGGLAAGAAVSLWGARGVMLGCNTAQAAALGLLVVAPGDLRWAAVVLVAVLAGAAGTMFLVALRSAIPAMVGDERRVWANSLMVSGRSLAMVGGFLSAGLVVSLFGYRAAFVVDAATFLACSAVVALFRADVARVPEEHVHEEETATTAAGRGRRTGQLRSAFTALRVGQGLVLMLLLRAVDGLGSSSHNAALPVYSAALDPQHAAAFVSRFWAFWAVGNLVVQQFLRVLARRTGRAGGMKGFGLGTMAMSASFIAVFCGFPTAVTVGVALVAGMSDGFTEVAYTSHLQALPEAVRGHAFGISATAENLGFGAGMVIVAGLLERFTPLTVVAVSHGLAIVVALGFLAVVARQPRAEPPADPALSTRTAHES
jgi:MFS family permease